MSSVLAGRDTLVVMPTGAGKSAIYQVPALLLDGPTVVVSPLIALQRDQVLALLAHGAASAAASANSSQPKRQCRAAFAALAAGDVEFFFLAPEQLAKPDVVAELAAARPSLIVIDEAHCVSSWGHEFRPDYLRLGAVIERLGSPTVCALTATAAPPVREEIVGRLNLRNPFLVVRGFDRPNIALSVQSFQDDDSKREAVELRAAGEPKPGLVYVATRRDAESYAGSLADLGLRAAAYHAGLSAARRNEVQARFMADDLDVVVATTAFGMGIDKANVRFVLHAAVAESLDSYYQEIGRGGRDGEPAEAVLFYRPEDLGLRRFFASGTPDAIALQRVATLLRLAGRPVEMGDLAASAQLSQPHLTGVLNLLEDAGAVVVSRDGRLAAAPEAPEPAAAATQAMEIAAARQLMDRSRIEMMRGYAETAGCRRQYLLGYFGETMAEPCGHCDTCADGTARQAPPARISPYTLNSRVEHRDWGAGTVLRHDGDRIVVLFDSVGYRTLSLEAVADADLLDAG